MIRTVALSLICIAGLGVIAGATILSTPPQPETVLPVVAGNKADRLPLVANEKVPQSAAKIDVAYVQPADEVQGSPPAEMWPSTTLTPADLGPKVDEPHSAKATKAHKPKQTVSRSRRIAAADQAAKQASEPPANEASMVKECSSSGLDPLLRKLNLAPPCS